MPTQFADLDELVLQCRSENARHHIKEAVLCYRAGAFRAAILSTWVALVYDFVDKFRELALDGDKQAEVLVNGFETIHKTANVEKALEFERTLLTVCKDQFDLLTAQELVDLERLLKDRNRCAHPNLIRHGEVYMPTAELARVHLRNVVEHVLQRPPKVGKSAEDQLFKEIQSDYFPTDPKQAIEVLKAGPLARPKENLLREFLLGITSTALKGDLPIREIVKRFAAIAAVKELHREAFLSLVETHFPKLLLKTPDPGLRYALPLVAKIPELQQAIQPALKARFLRCIELAPDGDLHLVLTSALQIKDLQETARIRVESLTEESVAAYLKSRKGNIPEPVIDRALSIYAEAGSFSTANSRGDSLMLPAIKSFTNTQVVRLFDIAKDNGQVLGSRKFDELVESVKEFKLLEPKLFDAEISKRGWMKFYRQLMFEPPPESSAAAAQVETTKS